MKITPTYNPKSLSLPLPIYKAIKIAKAVDKNNGKFEIYVGLNKTMISQLTELSRDKSDVDLHKYARDQARFGTGSYSEWYKKNRTPFTLVHTATNALAALVWFGPKPLGQKSLELLKIKDSSWHTISFRAYPGFRGKGLTKKFVAFATDIYMKKFPDIKIWSGINTENTASQKLSESLGFKTLEKLSDRKAHWLVMVKY